MAILGIGVDFVYIPRIAAVLQHRGSRFPSRILCSEELFQWKSLPDLTRQVHFLAVRWAVKEAAYKALYPVVHPTWKELAYMGLGERSPGAKPALVYRPFELAERSRIGPIHLSVSHDDRHVFACVTVECPDRG